jgi:hypothetical protein
MKTPIHLNNKRNEIMPSVRPSFDYVFSWASIITAFDVVIDARYTIYVQVGSTMTTSSKSENRLWW